MGTNRIDNSVEQIPDTAKDKYVSVLKRFPDIGKGEIELVYASYVPYANLKVYKEKGDSVKTVMTLGLFFFELFDEKEREAIIAHEAGHHVYRKKHSPSEAKKLSDEFDELESYYKRKNSEEKIVITYTDEEKRRMKELQDNHNAYEFYADDEAVKLGYGQQILSSLEKIAEKHYNRLSQMSKEAVKSRIERLKLIEKNERVF